MINLPSTASLLPREVVLEGGRTVYTFPGSTELVKLDFLYEAGSVYQSQRLCSAATNKLLAAATRKMNSSEVSEFMDYRGVILEHNNTPNQSMLTVYMLRRHADEVIPIVADMLSVPAFAEDDFRLWQKNRRQELATMEQRTSHIARRMFYQSLFGEEHPLGVYATVGDVDKLELASLRSHFAKYYSGGAGAIVAAGCVDDGLMKLLDRHFGRKQEAVVQPRGLGLGIPQQCSRRLEQKMAGAVQTSMRIGRVLPLRWDEPDYARLMLLVTAIGGYFGSRLMSNVREDKGYTYGIYARTQIYRGAIVFFVSADVAAGTTDDAVKEVMHELQLLSNKPMEEEELQLVKTVLVGDFLRSVDGTFELSARFCDMLGTGVDERLTDNIRTAINEATAAQLQELAQRLLRCEDMTVCLAGV